jgi:transcriptional regulator with XRE-family HTH domain
MGEKIQDLRRRSGMSQDALAEQLGVSRQAVSKWERDEAVPEADKIVSLPKAFHVSTDYLLTDEPAPQAAPAQPQTNSTHAFFRQLERYARRHGYKGGFVLSGVGALVCAISLGLRAITNSMVSGMTGSFDSIAGGMLGGFGGGFEGVPGYGDMLGGFQQSVDQMHSFASNMGNIFLILLIPGIALIAAGIAVVIIGKKYAKATP